MRKTERKFEFSVVMAVYNVAPFLKEAVRSLARQTFGFGKIQLILVDDGSTDGSGALCDAFAAKYPRNVVVVHKENGGVSSARNAGLALAEGRYINFMDPDDKMSKNAFAEVHRFFQEHGGETDVVTIPMYFFEAQSGPHWQNYKFANGSRVIDLNEEPDNILMTHAASFFTADIRQTFCQDASLVCGEDAKEIIKFLSRKMRLGVLDTCRYYYRRRAAGEQSLIQTSRKKKGWYLDYLEHFALWAYRFSLEKFGFFHKYIQYVVLADLQWRLRGTDDFALLNEEEKERYISLLLGLFKLFDDDVILGQRMIFTEHKVFLLMQKYGAMPDLVSGRNEVALVFADRTVSKISVQAARVEFVKIEGDTLHIEGFLRFVGLSEEEPVGIEILSGKSSFPCTLIDRNTQSRLRFGIPLYRDVGFSADIPLEGWGTTIRIACAVRDTRVVRQRLTYGIFSSVGTEYRHGYFHAGHWAVQAHGGGLSVRNAGRRGHLEREVKFLAELFFRREWKNLACRLYYHLFRNRGRREYWLLSDRANKADDNGEAFFEYLRKNKRGQVKAAFLIRKDCKDYKRIKKIGKVVPFCSVRHKLHYLICDKVVSSAAEEYFMFPIIKSKAFRDITAEKKFVFLQHGIIKGDLSDWLNKYSKNIFRFITSTDYERQSILEGKYFYSEKEIILTGLCRYDRLYNAPKKQIVIMPTWRKYLVGRLVNGVWSKSENFKNSEYFRFYNALINDERLLSAAERYGYTVAFLPHPNTYNAYIEAFEKDPRVKFLPTDSRYRDVFAESDLMITDYSSVMFDFAYLKKPIVYCQFDRDRFYSGGHVGKHGYFDERTDGFGEVCSDLDSAVETVVGYMQEGCALKKEYAERIDRTFAYRDRKNCDRVFDAIFEK